APTLPKIRGDATSDEGTGRLTLTTFPLLHTEPGTPPDSVAHPVTSSTTRTPPSLINPVTGRFATSVSTYCGMGVNGYSGVSGRGYSSVIRSCGGGGKSQGSNLSRSSEHTRRPG